MKALHIHAGPVARRHIEQHGLRPSDVALVPAAAGGPKGLILSHIDRQLFGSWFNEVDHPLHLVGASIGAWRMAAAAMPNPVKAFEDLAQVYISQRYDLEPGKKMPTPASVSRGFEETLRAFFERDLQSVLHHPTRRLHVLTSRGRHVLRAGGRVGAPLGFAGLVLANAVSRRGVGAFLERHVFSTPGDRLPIALDDQPTRHITLTEANFLPAVQASCSIPFVLDGVRNIPGTRRATHWDGGLIDYHLHWDYAGMPAGLVLYPHFQRTIVPGWLDKVFKSRHRPTPGLDNVVTLVPNPEWVASLPNGKLPDRNDFKALGEAERIRDWTKAVAESARLADEWQMWLDKGCPVEVIQPL
ncbi:patatin-like phospholipase family protein [Aquabacterium sp.]|uniref:patatin-like phospholipase family protein n=1 Tax=Aquabacterium sp. TaxID=1872578 RepID=UPI0035B0EAB7